MKPLLFLTELGQRHGENAKDLIRGNVDVRFAIYELHMRIFERINCNGRMASWDGKCT